MKIFRDVALIIVVLVSASAYAWAADYHVAHIYSLGISGGFDYMTIDPASNTLYIAQGDKVVVFDTRQGIVTGTIPGMVHVHGFVFAPDGKNLYVSDGGADVVRIIDRATLKETGTISVGTNPDGMVLEPTTGHLFVFNGKSKDLSVVDLSSKKVVALVPLAGRPEFPVTDGAGNVYDNIEDLHQVLKIDAAQNKVVATWTLAGCESPSGQAIDLAGHRNFSVCDNGQLMVTNTTTGKPVAMSLIGKGPDAVAFDSNQKLIFSSNGNSGTLSIVQQIGPDHYTSLQTVKTAPGGRTLALNSITGCVYVVAPDPKATGKDPKPLVLIEVSR